MTKVQLGRNPRVEGDSAFALQPQAGTPPPRPAEVHNIELDAADRNMYGNDVWGDCIFVMIEKDRVVSAEALGVTITKLTPPQVIKNYCDYCGIGTDPKTDAPGPGADILSALKWAQNHPERFGGSKLLFYGDFPITDDAMQEAVAEFCSVCVGVTVYASMEFPARVWYTGPRGKKVGGHGVAGGSYTALGNYIKTWGYMCAINGAGFGTIDELVVCIWDFQWAALTYARQTEVVAAFTAVTGRPWTGPAPIAPTPIPTPTPVPGILENSMVVHPARLADTRPNNPSAGALPTGKIPANTVVAVPTWGLTGIPSGAKSFEGNFTVLNASAAGNISVSDSAVLTEIKKTSILNPSGPGDTRPNHFTVPLDAAGRFYFSFNAPTGQTCDVIIDTQGFGE